jgi:hypothetical protein
VTYWSEAEAKRYLGDRYVPPEKKPNKYNAQKVTIDGRTFDSVKEANYYCELKLRKMAHDIKDFNCQVVYVLLKSFTHRGTGRRVRKEDYIADFVITHNDGHTEVVDVKGYRTRVYRNKIKLFLAQYQDIVFTEVE